jgi:predicted RNA-binding protein
VNVVDCEAWTGVGGEGVIVSVSGDAVVMKDILGDGEETGVESPGVNKTADMLTLLAYISKTMFSLPHRCVGKTHLSVSPNTSQLHC